MIKDNGLKVEISPEGVLNEEDLKHGRGVNITHVDGTSSNLTEEFLEAAVASNVINRAVKKGNGRVSYPLFEAVAKNFVLTSLEVVPINISPDGQFRVYVEPRSEKDPIPRWRGKYAFPGHMITIGDTTSKSDLSSAWDELQSREFEGKTAGDLVPVGDVKIVDTQGRGSETASIHWVDVDATLTKGKYVRLTEIGDLDMLGFHRDVVLKEVLYTLLGDYFTGRWVPKSHELPAINEIVDYLGIKDAPHE